KEDGVQFMGVNITKDTGPPSHSPADETVFAKPAKPASKERKKKKLKRGKTTSVTLQKTHGFDVEEDVIWIDDKPDVHEPEGPSTGRRTDKVETQNPGPAVEYSQAAESANSAPSQPEAPGPKKRGRKRKKTSEQMAPEESTDKPPQ
ncbi:hypothetical protein PHISP_08512, partial [Aspergillus sp. HF37]